MKVEINLEGKRIARVFAIALVGIAIGYTLSMVAPANIAGNAPMGYLTTADLNRDDIGASIVLSRFCEGMGLRSSVYWQQDAQGNEYGQPICLRQQ
ncbi:MAG: hypothetical protein Q8N60_03635 [Candidatus Diapherotrites archaeon]|nr:hypothetical protein [Candidatus Diapherotrites archaeon]